MYDALFDTIDDCGAWRGPGVDYLSALGIASRRLDLPMMALLLEYGANPARCGEDGRDAWQQLPKEADAQSLAMAVALLRPFQPR
jgi:hypothetical protein